MENDTWGIISEGDTGRTMTIWVNASLWTAFPLPDIYSASKATITEINQWKNLIEGWLRLNLKDMSLTVFDPFFYLHRGRIKKESNLHFSALAYTIQPVKEVLLRLSEEGRRELGIPHDYITTKEASIIFPLKGAAIDDYAGLMPVVERREVEIWGERGHVFAGPLINSSPPLMPPIVATRRVIQGRVPEVGEELFAYVWLIGAAEKGDFEINGTLVEGSSGLDG
ncbi:MAG: hypothetical protein QW379_04800 [Thermoplasmata archaeon]